MSAPRSLVIAADVAIQQWLKGVLEGMGSAAVVTPDAFVGLQALRRDGPFELAVATLSWSDMSALTWARWSHREGYATPLVLLVAYADADLRAWVRDTDGVTLVDRSVTEAELVKHLVRVRERAVARRDLLVREQSTAPPPFKIVVHERRQGADRRPA